LIRLMFIIPYESMEEEIQKVLRAFPCREEISYRCALYYCIDLNNYKQEWPCDALIARGYSADVIAAQNPPFPVLKMNFSSTETINAIKECKEKFNPRKIAVIGHPSLSLAAETIKKISDIPIEIYTLDGPFVDIPSIVQSAVDNGFDTVIGGGTAYSCAKEKHLNSYLVGSDVETLWKAVNEAVTAVTLQRQERAKTQILKTVMDNSSQGFMLTGTDGTINVCNKFASKIFDISMPENTGLSFSSVVPELSECFSRVIDAKTPVNNEMFKRRGKIYAAYLKPVIVDRAVNSVLIVYHDISSIQEMENQIRNKLFAKGMVTRYQFGDIINNSPQMKKIVEMSKKIATVDSNILIGGETGTGKEMFAQSIHHASARANRPFVAVNCAAIPEHLLESELFGYSAGSFTGASKEGKRGLFEIAHSGTLFLDEISELPYSFQGKLLRVLQEREIRRIGDDKIIPVNIRIIAATNKDLQEMVSENKFRKDLYFRLDILEISIPPLRERKEDILPLFYFFLKKYSLRFNKPIPDLSASDMNLLTENEWIGNIRELKNIAERFMVLCEENLAPAQILESCLSPSRKFRLPAEDESKKSDRNEKERILSALASGAGKGRAAKALGMGRSTLWRKMKRYHIE